MNCCCISLVQCFCIVRSSFCSSFHQNDVMPPVVPELNSNILDECVHTLFSRSFNNNDVLICLFLSFFAVFFLLFLFHLNEEQWGARKGKKKFYLKLCKCSNTWTVHWHSAESFSSLAHTNQLCVSTHKAVFSVGCVPFYFLALLLTCSMFSVQCLW